MRDVSKVLVVGAGTMGHGIAQVFARKGFKVTVFDQSTEALEKGKNAVRQELDFLVKEQAVSPENCDQALGNLEWTADIAAATESDFVVEAIIEDLKTKQELFSALDKICRPDTILASNTSGISITAIAGATGRQEKVAGMHWWNPPYIIPVIEIIRGDQTSDETIEAVKELTRRLEKKPVVVNKDIPGFLGNRMQYAMMREAIYLLEEGVASAEDIDLMVRAGFGFKFPVIGPLETIDMAGFDIYQKVSAYLYRFLCNGTEPHSYIEENISRDRKGIKSGAGFYEYSATELPKLLQERTSKLLAILKDTGHKV